jgi:hypothetical protein
LDKPTHPHSGREALGLDIGCAEMPVVRQPPKTPTCFGGIRLYVFTVPIIGATGGLAPQNHRRIESRTILI